MSLNRPSPARQGVASSAAVIVVLYLAGTVLLTQALTRLPALIGTVGTCAALLGAVLLGTCAYVWWSRRYDYLDGCTADPITHAVDAVDAQIAQLVRAGVDEDTARTLVRDVLVRGMTRGSGGGTSVEDLLKRVTEGARHGADTNGTTSGQYL